MRLLMRRNSKKILTEKENEIFVIKSISFFPRIESFQLEFQET